MKRRSKITVIIIIAAALLIGLAAVLFIADPFGLFDRDTEASDSSEKADEESGGNSVGNANEWRNPLLESIGVSSVKAEWGDIVKKADGDKIRLDAELPDYTSLYVEAAKTADPLAYIEDAIRDNDIKWVKRSLYVEVTYDENGEAVIDKDAAIKRLVEEELIKAVNAATEAGETAAETTAENTAETAAEVRA